MLNNIYLFLFFCLPNILTHNPAQITLVTRDKPWGYEKLFEQSPLIRQLQNKIINIL